MMREFQAENERRRTSVENNSTSLLNADSNEIILQSTSNEQSVPSTPIKQNHLDQQTKTTNPLKMNTLERRSTLERNKFNTKTNRLASDSLKVKYLDSISNINHLHFRHRDVQIMLHRNQILPHLIIMHEPNTMM